MSDASDTLKQLAMANAATFGATAALPTATSMISTAATAATGAFGAPAAFVATTSVIPVLVPVGLVVGAAYGSAKLVGWIFDWFDGK